MKHYLIQLIAAYFVGIFCTFSVEAPKDKIFKISIIDSLGWLAYLICYEHFQFSAVLSTYLAGVVIAGLSHWFARLFHEPVTVFFIPGFFTLVPGGGMYRTALYLFQGQQARGLSELGTTLYTALAIALAVFTVDTIVQVVTRQRFSKFIRLNRSELKNLKFKGQRK